MHNQNTGQQSMYGHSGASKQQQVGHAGSVNLQQQKQFYQQQYQQRQQQMMSNSYPASSGTTGASYPSYRPQQPQQQQQATSTQQQQQAAAPRKFGPMMSQKYNEPIVGYIESSGRFVCNTEIYQEKLKDQVKFIALISKELNGKFMSAFQEHNENVKKLEQLDPEMIKRKFRTMTSNYFALLKENLNTQRLQVLQKIQSSQGLAQLENILEGGKEFFNVIENARMGQMHSKQDQFEKEKKIFDQKITTGKFASIVKRQEFYKELINSLDANCSKMRNTIDASNVQMSKVFQLKRDDRFIESQLQQFIYECIDVDMSRAPLSPHSLKPSVLSNASSPSVRSSDSLQVVVEEQPPSSSGQQPVEVKTVEQKSANSLDESSHSANVENTNQSASSGSAKPASPSADKPQPPEIEKPVNPGPFMVPQMPASLNEQQRRQFSMFVNMKLQQHREKLAKYEKDLAAYNTAQAEFQQKLETWQRASSESNETNQVVQPVEQKTFYEHEYTTAFKLKSMKLLQLVPGQGWRQLTEIKDLYMAKIAYPKTCDKVYVIGGAQDQRSKQTVTSMQLYHLTQQGIHKYDMAPMHDPRASFGSLYCENNTILVAGGYINGKLTTQCEVYSVAANKWQRIPELNEAKASSSLCLLGKTHYLCMGGLSRNQSGQAYLTNTVEVLEMAESYVNRNWTRVPVQLPISGCDIGCIPTTNDTVLIFGGWNKTAQTGVFTLTSRQPSDRTSLAVQHLQPLSCADFFLVNSIAMPAKDAPGKIRISGHSQVFTFDLASSRFECHAAF